MLTQINLNNGFNIEGAAPLIFNEHFGCFPSCVWMADKDYDACLSIIKEVGYVEEISRFTVFRYITKEADTMEDVPTSTLYKLRDSIFILLNRETRSKNADVGIYFIPGRSVKDLSDKFVNTPKFKSIENSRIYTLISEAGSLNIVHSVLNPIELDIQENYNDDFMEIDDLIKDRISNSKKGIVMLHGDPGTGKTYYLRHLIHHLNKKVIYVPASVANELSSPHFIPLLLNNTNSVLVIEDAENIIRTRKSGGNAAVSNLLNLADGLLSDVLSTQLICSFNCDINDIDEALLRKGRIIARYKFEQLKTEKAQKLSNKLGFQTTINKPMTLTEIYNQDDSNFNSERAKIGF